MRAGAVACTGAIAALQPARDLAGRIRDGNWARADFYLIPKLFDDLPEGTVVLSPDIESATKTYALFGKHFTNRVIDQRQWQSMLAESLDAESVMLQRGVDLIYFRGSAPEAPGSLPPGWLPDRSWELVFDDCERPLSPKGPITRVFRVGMDEIPSGANRMLSERARKETDFDSGGPTKERIAAASPRLRP